MDGLEWIVQVLAAAVGPAAFALLFNVPPHCSFRFGVIGGLGWLCYLSLDRLGMGSILSVFAATALVVFCSRYSAVRRRCPVTLFLIPGIFPLVPGAGIYWTAYYVVTDQVTLAAQKGFSTLKAAVAIVLGILLVFELPQSVFRVLAGRREQ